MMQKLLFVLSLFVASLLSGCASTATTTSLGTPQQVTTNRSVIDLLPADAQFAAYVDIDGMRAAPLYLEINKSIENWRDAMEQLSKEMEKDLPVEQVELWDFLATARWAAAFALEGEDKRDLTFISGSFTEDDAKTALTLLASDLNDDDESLEEGTLPEQDGEAQSHEVRLRTWKGHRIQYTQETAAVILDDDLLVLAESTVLEQVLERLAHGGETHSVPFHDRFVTFEHQVMVTVRDVANLSEKEGEDEADGWLEERLDDVLLALDISDGAYVEIIARCNADNTPAELKKKLEEDIASATDSEYVVVLGFRELLQQLELSVQEDQLHIGLQIDALDAHLMWGRVSGIVSAAILATQLLTDFIDL